MTGSYNNMTSTHNISEIAEVFDKAIEEIQIIKDENIRAFVTACLQSIQKGKDPISTLGLLRPELYESRIKLRDHWIREAYRMMSGTSQSARCEDLVIIAEHFQFNEWLRWKHLLHPPEYASQIHIAIFNALRAEERFPRKRRLMDICAI